MKKIFFVALALTAIAACKNAQPTAQAGNAAPTAAPEPVDIALPDSMYRIIVSFISIGEGIDVNAVQQLEEITINHQRDFGMPLAKEEYRWGREGEVDICFKMKDSSRKAKDAFAREVRAKFEANKLVQIEENAVCRHKR